MGGDVKQAYKQAKWPEHLKKLLARMPAGYKQFFDGQMHCVEVGNLFGHPKAGRYWWKEFEAWMLNSGYTQSAFDPCLFFTTRGDEKLWVIIYVDDIITFPGRLDPARRGRQVQREVRVDRLQGRPTSSSPSTSRSPRSRSNSTRGATSPTRSTRPSRGATPHLQDPGHRELKGVYEASESDTSQADTELKRFAA